MRIDQPRQDNLPAQIEDRIRGLRQLGGRADLLDDSIDRKNSGIFQFPSRTIHGDEDFGMSTQYASHNGYSTGPGQKQEARPPADAHARTPILQYSNHSVARIRDDHDGRTTTMSTITIAIRARHD